MLPYIVDNKVQKKLDGRHESAVREEILWGAFVAP
jgi:hypothetical protein